MKCATQQEMIRVNVAGHIIITIKLYKRWETLSGVSLTFISSVFTGRTINKSACGGKATISIANIKEGGKSVLGDFEILEMGNWEISFK